MRGRFNDATGRLVDGTVTLPDGRVYAGRFCESTGRPLDGTKLTDERDVYVGEFNAQWQRHGKGRAWLQDGTRYEGRFECDDLVEGTVHLVDAEGVEMTFTGTLRDEQFVRGVLRHRDFTYTGTFECNEPHGRGKIEFTSGAVQDGTFARGRLHGPQCKWRLESGVVYLGAFTQGVITSGELRTATYTYEGEFNERGQAHGIGRQEQHATQPKLIFTGRWNQGTMIEGQCADEFGSPVDWRNAPQLHEQLMRPEDRVTGSYMEARLAETRQRMQETQTHIAQDVEAARSERGQANADAFTLGYEAGPLTSQRLATANAQREGELQRAAAERAKAEAADLARRQMPATGARVSGDGPAATDDASSVDAVDAAAPLISHLPLAHAERLRQRSQQMLQGDRMEEQFERFKLRSRKSEPATAPTAASPSSVGADDDVFVDDAEAPVPPQRPRMLRAEGNEVFVSVMSNPPAPRA
jgi:hypothetical protein